MKEKVLNYLKQAALFFIAHPLSHWLGVLIGGVFSLIAAFILKEDYPAYSSVIEYSCLFTVPFISLFFFVQYFTGYDENEHFSLKAVIASILPLFVFQWIYLLIWGPAFWLHGICPHITALWLPKHTELWPDAVILLALQLFVYIPIYLYASHCGYRRKMQEAEYSE